MEGRAAERSERRQPERGACVAARRVAHLFERDCNERDARPTRATRAAARVEVAPNGHIFSTFDSRPDH
jgi:hypothetical protein